MVPTELDLLRRIPTESLALIPYEEKVTREGLIRRGWALGFLMGIIDVTTLKKQTLLRRAGEKVVGVVSNIVFTGQECNLHVFCGAEPVTGEDLVARAYVRSELKVVGGGGLSIEAGVELDPPTDGISRHWFWVGTKTIDGAGYKKLAQVEVTDEGGILFSGGDTPTRDMARMSGRAREELMRACGVDGLALEVLNLASDFRYIGAVMSAMAAHGLGNPYKEQRTEQIWRTFLGVEYEKWKPVLGHG